MNKATEDFHDYILHDVLGHIEHITSRKMFGGYGFYLDGRIFAIITGDDEICFKGNAELRDRYESAGGKQFIYTGHKNKQPTAMPYWSVPEEILEDRERIMQWTQDAAALSTKK